MNDVIIFGGNHYNALGLARTLGLNDIHPYGVLTTTDLDPHNNFSCYSKYWKGYHLVRDEKEGLEYILNHFTGFKEKPVIMPSSDGAAVIIDQNLNRLKDDFYVPSINETQNAIADLMDKYRQNQWASQLGLKVAKTWLIDFNEGNYTLPDITFPCILKPVLSPEGKKSDIKKCENAQEVCAHIDYLKKHHYHRILIQEFLKKDYEVELFGCILKNNDNIPFILSKHLREWPLVGGSVCCHEFIMDENKRREAKKILHKIKKYGYVGNIDIELFSINGEYYLNEVNFRNSGDVYACIPNKLFYPFYHYLDITGQSTDGISLEYTNKYYAMNEISDLRYVRSHIMPLYKWMGYLLKCRGFAYYDKSDVMPAIVRNHLALKARFRK